MKSAGVSLIAFSFAINLLMLTAPLFMLQVFNRVLTSRNEDTLWLLLAIAVFALMVLAGLDAVRGVILARSGAWLDERLSAPIFRLAVEGAVQVPGSGNVQGLRDLSLLRAFLTGPSMVPLLDAPWMPVFIGTIYLLHPLLGWIALGGALALFALALTNELTTRTRLQSSGAGALRALREADLATRNADVINAMGMTDAVVQRWRPGYLFSSHAQNSAGTTSAGISALSRFLRFSLQIGLLAMGAGLVLSAELTPGAMIAASILLGRALAPVEQSISAWKLTQAARQAFARLKPQLARARTDQEQMPLPRPAGHVEVDNVIYFHPGAEDPTLHGVGFDLPAGKSLAIVGPTAAGKTTLARVLVGNLAPRVGKVRLDGMDVAQWDRADLGKHIGYLPQDIELFSGTIADNIARMQEPDADAVITAARLAGVHDLILRLPRGYDTAVGPEGARLSGGQRQRIGLARALYGIPSLVVLDEPNSNLDGEGELALAKALGALREQGVTAIVITQRAGILNTVDQILVLNEGRVQRVGPREDVLRNLATPGSASNVSGPGQQPREAR